MSSQASRANERGTLETLDLGRVAGHSRLTPFGPNARGKTRRGMAYVVGHSERALLGREELHVALLVVVHLDAHAPLEAHVRAGARVRRRIDDPLRPPASVPVDR